MIVDVTNLEIYRPSRFRPGSSVLFIWPRDGEKVGVAARDLDEETCAMTDAQLIEHFDVAAMMIEP